MKIKLKIVSSNNNNFLVYNYTTNNDKERKWTHQNLFILVRLKNIYIWRKQRFSDPLHKDDDYNSYKKKNYKKLAIQ